MTEPTTADFASARADDAVKHALALERRVARLEKLLVYVVEGVNQNRAMPTAEAIRSALRD